MEITLNGERELNVSKNRVNRKFFFDAFPQLEKKLLESIDEPFYPQAEYWCGHVLAYYLWYSCKSFAEILGKYPLERIFSDYHLMHEADITKMVQAMDAVVLGK